MCCSCHVSEDVVFYRTTNRDLVQVEKTPGLVFSKNISGHPFEVIRKALLVKEDELAENEIYDFIDAHKYPIISQFHIHLVVNEESLRDANFLELVREAGKGVQSKCYSDFCCTNAIYPEIQHGPPCPKKFDPDTVIAFSKSITSGDTKYRQYASGKIPENQSENGITIVVRDTLDAIAKDPEKDVLMHVYQPEDDESIYINSDLENLAKA
eukprot:jgi/Picre1/32335/NNA_007681.t1